MQRRAVLLGILSSAALVVTQPSTVLAQRQFQLPQLGNTPNQANPAEGICLFIPTNIAESNIRSIGVFTKSFQLIGVSFRPGDILVQFNDGEMVLRATNSDQPEVWQHLSGDRMVNILRTLSYNQLAARLRPLVAACGEPT